MYFRFPCQFSFYQLLYINLSSYHRRYIFWILRELLNNKERRKERQEILEELIAYFPLIRHWAHRKQRLQQFFIAAGTSLPSSYLATIGGYTDRARHRCPTILLLLLVFFAAGTCLPSRCLATKGGMHFTEPLPSNNRRDRHTDTHINGRDL
jgi:hypothetical protein